MQPQLCSRCKKNIAVIFITKLENGKTVNEGLCLKCARELGLKPVDDMMQRMGLSDEDIDSLNGEMNEAMNGLEGMLAASNDEPDTDEDGDDRDSQTATFPFLNKLFGNAGNSADDLPARKEERPEQPPRGDKPNGQKNKKHKC